MKLSGRFHRWLIAILVIAFLPSAIGNALAQSTGDYRSAASGNWNSTATWERFDGSIWIPAATTPTSSDGVTTIRNTHTVTITASVTTDQVTIDSGGQVTVNATSTVSGTVATDATLATSVVLTNGGSLTVNGRFQLDSGGYADGPPFTYGPAGELRFNNTSGSYGVDDHSYWPASSGPPNVIVQGSSGITLNVARTVSGVFQTAAGVLNGNNLTLNGTAQIYGGGFFIGSPTYGGTSTLEYHTGGSYGRGDEWAATAGAGYPNHVRIAANTTLDLGGNGGAATVRQCAGDLTIDSGSELTMNNGTNAMSAALTVLGDLDLAGTLTLSSLIGGDLELAGDWTRTGIFNTNDRAVFFIGSSAQNVTGPTIFAYAILDNANGLTLQDDETFAQTLTFLNGKITTGARTLTIGPSGSIVGASAARYVHGNLKKRVAISSGAGSQTWEIGDAARYAPVDLATTTGNQSFDATVSTTSGDHPNIGTSGLNAAKTVNRHYSLSSSPGNAFTAADLTFHFDPADVDAGANTNLFVVKKYDVPNWTSPTVGTRTATSTQATGVTSFSDFQIGELSPAGISINDVAQAEGNAGTTAWTFNVTLSAASLSVVTVQYATADGSATTANNDYVAESGTVTFEIGQTSKPVSIDVNGDVTRESNETFVVDLTSPTNATITDAQGTGTITNDDALPSLSINDVTVSEGNAGTTSATFTVTLSAPSDQIVTASYATANGSATTANGDYVAATGTVTFPAMSTAAQSIAVSVNGDLIRESNETFVVDLTTPTNATISDAQGVGTITNDDALPSLSINDVTVSEGNAGTTSATFAVSLSAPSDQVITVSYATANGSATTANNDYAAATGMLTFPAKSTASQSIVALVNGDVTRESNETFVVNLSSPTNATLSDPQGVGTINNDDSVPSLSIGDVSIAEGNAGASQATFIVSLSAPTDLPVTVSFASANGSATIVDGDYAASTGTLTFPAKSTSQQEIVVQVNGDITNESDETFVVNLSSPTNATLADAQGTGTITNDDDAIAPVVSVIDPNGGESIVIGQALELLWTASDNVGLATVDLELSRDGGSSFETIALGEPNVGSRFWTVTGPATTQALLRVTARDAAGNAGGDASDAVWTIFPRSNDVGTEVVRDFALSRVSPNPAREEAVIEYAVAREARVRVSVVDIQGRQVALLAHGVMPAGRHRATWSPEAHARAGVYLVRYEVQGRAFTRRLAVTR